MIRRMDIETRLSQSGTRLRSMMHSAIWRHRRRPLPHGRGSDQNSDSCRQNSDDVPGVPLPMGAHGAVLLLVTFLNATVAVTARAATPSYTNWDVLKITLRDVWNATGYAAWCLVFAWIILRLFVTDRFNRLMRVGLAISAIHAVFWFMSPSWS